MNGAVKNEEPEADDEDNSAAKAERVKQQKMQGSLGAQMKGTEQSGG